MCNPYNPDPNPACLSAIYASMHKSVPVKVKIYSRENRSALQIGAGAWRTYGTNNKRFCRDTGVPYVDRLVSAPVLCFSILFIPHVCAPGQSRITEERSEHDCEPATRHVITREAKGMREMLLLRIIIPDIF